MLSRHFSLLKTPRIIRTLTVLLACSLPLPGTLAIQIGDVPPDGIDSANRNMSASAQPAANQTVPVPDQTGSHRIASSHYGTHGMALFGGKQGLYASHLPMFHPPHDVQVVFRLHLQDAKQDAELRQRLARQSELWTLEPEKFDLQRLSPGHALPLRQFSARIVQGHFERDGKVQYAAQTVVVEQVLLYQPLSAERRPANMGHYLVIGKGKERFALKKIDRRPDFDWISVLHAPASLTLPAELLIPNQQKAGKLLAPDSKAWQKALHPWRGKAKIGRNLYFETGDLE